MRYDYILIFSSCVIFTDCAVCLIIFDTYLGEYFMMRYLLLKQLKSEKDLEISRRASPMVAKDTQNVIVKSKYFHCSSKKSKRFRSAFTTEQIDYLDREFKKCPYIGSGNRKEVANKLNIPERAVKIWFQNRRMKEKKESLNKEFDIEAPSKEATQVTNEQLNNWQSNNGHCSTAFLQAKISPVNCSVKPIAQATSATKRQVCSSNKPTASEVMRTNNLSKSSFEATKKSINVDAVPVTRQKVKCKSNRAPVVVPKQKNVCQNQGATSKCPLSKRYLDIDQDMPQDLSSKKYLMNKLYSQQPHYYPVNAIPSSGFVPLHMQRSYTSPALPPGNMIWKPVNMLSTLPVPHSSSATIGVPQSSAELHLFNNQFKNSCECNCVRSLVQCYNEVNARPHPQYNIVAIPFINPPK